VIGGKVLDASALAVAWADIPSSGLFLARIGSKEQPTAAHVLQCAHGRGWPVLTADPHTLRALDSSVEVEELP
jgi:hypothetical protein